MTFVGSGKSGFNAGSILGVVWGKGDSLGVGMSVGTAMGDGSAVAVAVGWGITDGLVVVRGFVVAGCVGVGVERYQLNQASNPPEAKIPVVMTPLGESKKFCW